MRLNFTPVNHNKFKNDEQKRALLERTQEEHSKLLSLVESYHQKQSFDLESDVDLCRNIVTAVDHILNGCDPESSLFLRNTLKPLQLLRERANELLQKIAAPAQEQARDFKLMPDTTLIYISIFQSEGHDLKKWETLLRSITSYLQGRPIYKTEEEMRNSIRSRLTQLSEAYVIAVVKKSAIENEDFMQRSDRLGNSLLVLKPNSITSSDILEFIHMDKHYQFINGKLV